GRRSVPTGGKGSASRKSAKSAKTRAKAPAKTRSSAVARAKTPVKSKAPAKAVKAPARGAKISPIGKAKMMPKGKTSGHSGNLMQGTLEFEAEPTMTTRSGKPLEMPPPPTPRRRGSAKPGSPDWPGESLTVGMMAPEFSLPSTLGRKVTLNEFRGKRVIL